MNPNAQPFTGIPRPAPPVCRACSGLCKIEVEVEKKVEIQTPVQVTREVVEPDGTVTEETFTEYHIETIIQIEIETVTCPRCGGSGDEPPEQAALDGYDRVEQAIRGIARWLLRKAGG